VTASPAPDAPVEVLLVEDNEGDAQLMIEALKEGNLWTNINVVDNGEEAVAYLRGEGPYAGATPPHLILLDLHLPLMNGHEVLAEIKGNERLRRIPIVILTASQDEEDFRRAYDLFANCCVGKPEDYQEFKRAVRRIELFWMTIPRRS
jgi:CheY-like chemotaxis protein